MAEDTQTAENATLVMPRGRLEAFSDAVIAILITIMVLSLRVPSGTNWTALRSVMPIFFAYVLSFIYLGIYWNNHHHMLMTVDRVNGAILWANLHLLFWLSLIPFVTSWMGAHNFRALPTALYGADALMAAIAYYILRSVIIRSQGEESTLAAAIGRDIKGKISPAAYIVAIPLAFVSPWISIDLYGAIALMWLVPDPRIEAGKAPASSH